MPKRRTRTNLCRRGWLCLFGALAVTGGAMSQVPTDLTVELVDQRIATLRAGGTPSDNTTLTTYEQTRGFLNDAGSYAREAATYVESLTSAPQREAEIQRRLDAQDEAYEPATELAGLTTDELRARLAEAAVAQRESQNTRPPPGGQRCERCGHPGQAGRNPAASRRVARRKLDARPSRSTVAGRGQSMAQRSRSGRSRK